MSDEICFDEEEIENILLDLEDDRKYLNEEIHKRCDYDIYSRLMDRLDSIEGMFEE